MLICLAHETLPLALLWLCDPLDRLAAIISPDTAKLVESAAAGPLPLQD